MKLDNLTIQQYLNKPIGKVRINKPVVNENRSFQCAADFQRETSQTGIYDLVLRESPHDKGKLYFSAELPAIISDSYFPNLVGGMPFGTPSNHDGEMTTIGFRLSIVKAVEMTFNCPNDWNGKPAGDFNVYVGKEHWEMIAEYFKACFDHYLASFDFFRRAYNTEPEDEFLSRIGMVGACGRWMDDSIQSFQKIKHQIKRYSKPWNLKYQSNADWAK